MSTPKKPHIILSAPRSYGPVVRLFKSRDDMRLVAQSYGRGGMARVYATAARLWKSRQRAANRPRSANDELDSRGWYKSFGHYKTRGDEPPRHGVRWTEREIGHLRQAAQAGWSLKRMCAYHERNASGVLQQLRVLGYAEYDPVTKRLLPKNLAR